MQTAIPFVLEATLKQKKMVSHQARGLGGMHARMVLLPWLMSGDDKSIACLDGLHKVWAAGFQQLHAGGHDAVLQYEGHAALQLQAQLTQRSQLALILRPACTIRQGNSVEDLCSHSSVKSGLGSWEYSKPADMARLETALSIVFAFARHFQPFYGLLTHQESWAHS